jgi:hypothetical protein
MNQVSWVRAVGVIGGFLLLSLGAAWLWSARGDPATQNADTLLVGLSLMVPGALLIAPWSRIRPPAVWYSLFITLVIVVPLGVSEILAVNTWSAIHGAGGPGFALAGLLLTLWIIGIASIWSLRPISPTAR